jgi:hypothetical protein
MAFAAEHSRLNGAQTISMKTFKQQGLREAAEGIAAGLKVRHKRR